MCVNVCALITLVFTGLDFLAIHTVFSSFIVKRMVTFVVKHQTSASPLTSVYNAGMSVMAPNWVRLAPNGTNLELLKIIFNTFRLTEPKCIETDL